MATIEKHGPSWRVRLSPLPDGRRPSKTFRTRAEASAWLREHEAGELADPSEATLAQALRRYAAEVSPTHKGERWEVVRLNKLAQHPMAAKPIQKLTAADFAAWRDERLKKVAPASVRRELGILGSVLDIARREWGLIRSNPLEDVRKPSAPASRKRRISDAEIERIVTALGYDGGPPQNASHLTALAFMLAIETAMRAGEILGLTWSNVRAKAVTLPATKNGDVRDVPLSPRAREILALRQQTLHFVVQRARLRTKPLHETSRPRDAANDRCTATLSAGRWRELAGKPCMVSVVESESSGKTYSNVQSVSKLPKGLPPPALEGEALVYFNANDAEDQATFRKLPEWLQKKIDAQIEPQRAPARDEHAFVDDDLANVPF